MEYSCKCQEADRPSIDNLALLSQLPTSVLYNCNSCGATWDYSRREGWGLLLSAPAEDRKADQTVDVELAPEMII